MKIKSIHLENFKGAKSQDIQFGDKTIIKGANASGKTTIVDAFTWLLFNKDSHGVEKFEVRPLNEDGTTVHYVDIIVSAVIDVDGKEYELKKVQKENWVKQRGSETAIFKGNENTYEIDGYPKSQAEYKDFINGIISEDMFKILTTPSYFPAMKWKEQREILMKFANTKSDFELATEIGGYELILPELEKAPSTEDILNKYKKSKKELETSLKEIPVRIDELSKQIVDVDVAELELMKKVVTEQEENKARKSKAIEDAKNLIFELGFKISDYERNANAEIIQNRTDADTVLLKAQSELRVKESELSALKVKLLSYESSSRAYTEESAGLGIEYKALKEKKFDESVWVFDESAKSCQMCGQILPKSRIDELVSTFETNKANARTKFENDVKAKAETVLARGRELKVLIEQKNEEIESCKVLIKRTTEEIEELKQKVDYFNKVISELPERVDLSADEKYIALVNEKANLEVQVKDLSAEIFSMNSTDISEIDRKLSSISNNANIESRIEELKSEQKDVAQRIATCEQYIYLVEQFIKAKLEVVSDSINSKFALTNFKLWDIQINGGIVECCVPTYGGVEYSDLNSGHRIVVGIDICNTLSKLLGVTAPIFVDNAESINTYNIPATDSQMICLYVSEDKSLVVD